MNIHLSKILPSLRFLSLFIIFDVQIWASRLLRMYTNWAKRQGQKGRVVEKHSSTNGGIKTASIEFEFKFAYGYLSGEKGVHSMIRGSQDGSAPFKVQLPFLFLVSDQILLYHFVETQIVCELYVKWFLIF